MADEHRNESGDDSGDKSAGAPDPEATLPELDDRQLRVLRQIGRAWGKVCDRPGRWRAALPVDPAPDGGVFLAELTPNRFGRVVRLNGRPPPLRVTGAGEAAPSWWGRAGQQVRRVLIGPPLAASGLAVERMRKLIALPVLSADALSSVAYGPEAMLTVLVAAGAAGLGYAPWISAVIAFLMLAVAVSYRQTMRAYPHGGGSYIVASDNLGPTAGLLAAAGLATDYVLTVAVSVSSGVAAMTSAVPRLAGDSVLIGVAVIVVLLAGNLRGVRQAGAVFAIPTYAFLVAMAVLIGVGLTQDSGHGFHAQAPPPGAPVAGVSVLLILRAFSSGATAMTGIEATSNAIPSFRPVEWRNARTTLTWMAALLIVMFVGTIVLVHVDGVVPRPNETVLSQLARTHLGSGWPYIGVQAATTAVLLLAANTAYNDFPRLLYLLAKDSYAPRPFLRIGDRLSFSNGIVALSVLAGAIFVGFGGRTEALIPLYAVGVFLAFTMSQAGMVVHWWRHRDQHWRKSLVFNAVGGALSAIVFVTAGITKFLEGAWLAIVVVTVLIAGAVAVHRHYLHAERALALHPDSVELPHHAFTPAPAAGSPDREHRAQPGEPDREREETPVEIRHLTIVPLSGLDLAGLRALAYAASLRQPVLALHISPTEHEAERFRCYWRTWGDHLPLQVIVSQHRAITGPIVHYIQLLQRQRSDLTVTVIVPELVATRWWQHFLHNRTATHLRRLLRPIPRTVVTSVPFHLPRR
ncbi:APC family permease [Nocardia stercoris]|uniref:APC family permease n=1 Tax=Nocardia stercoris TaxID=2483361 RepID=A0A3M2L1N3_9NOCA|nr:APC family permease [Nocardia stercoris]RMI31294.1 APC family permease [Nocardia stercoris]